MKPFLTFITGTLCLILITISGQAQTKDKLQAGVALNFGEEFFKIKNHNYLQDISLSESRSSVVAVGGGLWLEKFISDKFSILPQIDYHFIKVNNNVTVMTLAKIPGPIRESYHSFAVNANARYSFIQNDNFRIFIEAGPKIDKMIRLRFQQAHLISRRSMPDDFGVINPGLLGGVGVISGRWGLTVRYERYFGQAEAKLMNPETSNLQAKRAVSRQNAMLRLTYAFMRR